MDNFRKHMRVPPALMCAFKGNIQNNKPFNVDNTNEHWLFTFTKWLIKHPGILYFQNHSSTPKQN